MKFKSKRHNTIALHRYNDMFNTPLTDKLTSIGAHGYTMVAYNAINGNETRVYIPHSYRNNTITFDIEYTNPYTKKHDMLKVELNSIIYAFIARIWVKSNKCIVTA